MRPTTTGLPSAAASVERGLALYDQGHYEGALLEFEAASDDDMNSLEAYGWIAAALAKLGRFEEAHRSADHALWLDHFSAWAWNRKGAVFFEARSWAQALTCFGKALELEPKFSPALENLRRTEPLAAVNAPIEDRPTTDGAGRG